jgi:hypothetical protein
VFDSINYTGNQPVKIFSYELKKELGFNNLRESCFQAGSNSSWANAGQVVVMGLYSEIRKLSNSCGISLMAARQKDIFDKEFLMKIKTDLNSK